MYHVGTRSGNKRWQYVTVRSTCIPKRPVGAVSCYVWFGQESEAGELVVSNTCRVTASQLREFLRRSLDKYKRALVEPGEVGSEIDLFLESLFGTVLGT